MIPEVAITGNFIAAAATFALLILVVRDSIWHERTVMNPFAMVVLSSAMLLGVVVMLVGALL